MALARRIEILPLAAMQSGTAAFLTPQVCHESMVVELAPDTVEELFVHRRQTDQLMVVRGACVLVVLENRRYRYLRLSEQGRQVVRIPPGVAHGAINLSGEVCVMVNAVIRHGEPDPRDYQPRRAPFPYDLEALRPLEQAIALTPRPLMYEI